MYVCNNYKLSICSPIFELTWINAEVEWFLSKVTSYQRFHENCMILFVYFILKNKITQKNLKHFPMARKNASSEIMTKHFTLFHASRLYFYLQSWVFVINCLNCLFLGEMNGFLMINNHEQNIISSFDWCTLNAFTFNRLKSHG